MLKVAMLSKWHVHAGGYADAVKKYGAEITGVWDENPDRGEAWAKELGCVFNKDLEKLLESDNIDAIVCDAPTTMHKDVLVAAANAKKHIFTEKALAPTVKECDEIAEAVTKNGVKFLISMPYRTTPQAQYAKKAIEEGLLGDITSLRIRVGHTGASANWLPDYWFDENLAGGGAMMDLGCHPMYTASYLLGKPARIGSMYNTTTGKASEDNAANVIEFTNGAIAVIESSLTTYSTPEMFEVYGTKGTLYMSNGEMKINCEKLSNISKGFITVTNMPEKMPLPIDIFMNACTKGTDIPFGLAEGRALTELLENAYIAHKTKKIVEVL